MALRAVEERASLAGAKAALYELLSIQPTNPLNENDANLMLQEEN